jgi:hypothetical protein
MKYGALYKRLTVRKDKLTAAAINWFEIEREKIEKKYKADLAALEVRRNKSGASHEQEIAALDLMLATLDGLMKKPTNEEAAKAEVVAENKSAAAAAVRATDDPPSFLHREKAGAA